MCLGAAAVGGRAGARSGAVDHLALHQRAAAAHPIRSDHPGGMDRLAIASRQHARHLFGRPGRPPRLPCVGIVIVVVVVVAAAAAQPVAGGQRAQRAHPRAGAGAPAARHRTRVRTLHRATAVVAATLRLQRSVRLGVVAGGELARIPSRQRGVRRGGLPAVSHGKRPPAGCAYRPVPLHLFPVHRGVPHLPVSRQAVARRAAERPDRFSVVQLSTPLSHQLQTAVGRERHVRPRASGTVWRARLRAGRVPARRGHRGVAGAAGEQVDQAAGGGVARALPGPAAVVSGAQPVVARSVRAGAGGAAVAARQQQQSGDADGDKLGGAARRSRRRLASDRLAYAASALPSRRAGRDARTAASTANARPARPQPLEPARDRIAAGLQRAGGATWLPRPHPLGVRPGRPHQRGVRHVGIVARALHQLRAGFRGAAGAPVGGRRLCGVVGALGDDRDRFRVDALSTRPRPRRLGAERL
eukprot:ctg_714.g293